MKLLFATFGSLGDIKPMVALAGFAKSLGHDVRLATSPGHRRVVENAGIEFNSFGQDAFFESEVIRASLVEPRTGFAKFMWHANLEDLERHYRQLSDLAIGAEALVATPLVMVAHLVCQKLGMPLISCVCSPAMVLSNVAVETHDPFQAEWRHRLNNLRSKIGLPRRAFPQMERYKADLTLGLYPRFFRQAKASYIRDPIDVGYPRYHDGSFTASSALLDWLQDRPSAIITYGSFVDADALACFENAANACKVLGLRCLYVTKHSFGTLKERETDQMRVEPFVDHSSVMGAASIVVHHGGTGTTVEALRALRPTVVTPFGLDQTYNAQRIKACDLGEATEAGKIDRDALLSSMHRAIHEWPRRRGKAAELASQIEEEDESRAVTLIEQLLEGQLGQRAHAEEI